MRRIEMLSLVSVLVLTVAALGAHQDHASSPHRAESVMGFDQSRTAHHFSLFHDGGAIEVGVKDPADTTNRDAIRSHLPHIATIFASGNFDAPMLVHDSNHVPGTKVMATLKDRIRYTYVEVPAGGRVNIMTSDREALNAVHQFLKFQIAEHKTGDSIAVQSR
jgi:hypothetical protein